MGRAASPLPRPAVPGRIVELVGPAGSGKSTLLVELGHADPSTRTDLSIWRQPRLRLAAAAIALTPVLIGSALERSVLRPTEFAQMVRLTALARYLRRVRRESRHLVVLDEGPVFALAWLEVFHGSLPGRRRAAWRRQRIEEWSGLLSGVILLDASNAVIAARIRGRRKPHMVKGSTDAGIARFTEAFRTAFERILRDLERCSSVPVIRRRTDLAVPSREVVRTNGAFVRSAGGG